MSGKGGAAIAAAPAAVGGDELARADQWEADALDAIERVQEPAEAEELLARVATVEQAMRLSKASGDRERRWRGIKLKAEARYGELLGPAVDKGGGRRTVPTGNSDRKAQHRARKVSAAKQADPEGFEDYVNNDPTPSRKGLLRKTAPPKPQPRTRPKVGKSRSRGELTYEAGDTLGYDDEVVQWVRERARRGWTRERIIATARAGEDGWPRPDKQLGNGGSFADVRQAIYRIETAGPAKRKSTEHGRRLRDTYLDRKNGNGPIGILNARIDLLKSIGYLAGVNLPAYGIGDADTALVFDFYDDLMMLRRWVDESVPVLLAHMDDAAALDRIRTLRERTVERGFTEAEARLSAIKADTLEAKFNAPRIDA